MFRAHSAHALAVGLFVAFSVVGVASATNYNITWLDMSPTAVGSSVPNNSVFNLPGVGPVTVTYSIPPVFADARTQNPLFQNGSVTSGPDTYSWGAHELFGATNNAPNPPFVNASWSITFTFAGTIPAQTLYVGVAGLGRTDSFGGGASVATVVQNGAYLGDWTGGGNYGANQYLPGPGLFSLQNSVSGPGGLDPWWNTALGVAQILDPVSSLTVRFSQLPGDGAGVNIGAVPEPTTAAMLALAALMIRRRR